MRRITLRSIFLNLSTATVLGSLALACLTFQPLAHAQGLPSQTNLLGSETLGQRIVPVQQFFLSTALTNRAFYLAAQIIKQQQEASLEKWTSQISPSLKACLEARGPRLYQRIQTFLGRGDGQESTCRQAMADLKEANQEFLRYLASRPEPETLVEFLVPGVKRDSRRAILSFTSTLNAPKGSPPVQLLYARDALPLLQQEEVTLSEGTALVLTFLGAKDVAEFTADLQKQVTESCKVHPKTIHQIKCIREQFPALWLNELRLRWSMALSSLREELIVTMHRTKQYIEQVEQIQPWTCNLKGNALQLGLPLRIEFSNANDTEFLSDWALSLEKIGVCGNLYHH